METKHTWVRIAMSFQFLTAAIHSIGLFVSTVPANETEAQLDRLMSGYKINLGGGFHPTMENLFISMSSCFTLLCLFGALLNLFLLRLKADRASFKHILLIQVFIFGCCFAIMVIFTFLLPIVSSGLIFVSLAIAWAVHK